jgi:dolichol-phosphate mannosyltransferase
MNEDFSDTTIIIPTLNESTNIGILLKYLINEYPNARVMVCDDGSQDGTEDIVRGFRGVEFLDRSSEKIHGLTASVLDGIYHTVSPYFVVIDGDCQHPPQKIREIVNLLRTGEDMVVACRSDVPGWAYHRRLMSSFATWLGETMLFIRRAPKCSDVLSGFFGGKAVFFHDIIMQKKEAFELEGYKVLFDLLKVSPKNIKISEVEYVFQTRAGGESKMNSRVIWKYLRSIIK